MENTTSVCEYHGSRNFCNTFIRVFAGGAQPSRHNDRCFFDELWGIALIEVFVRLGLALLLSLSLAVLMAWGWDNSDHPPPNADQQMTQVTTTVDVPVQ